MKWFFSIIKNYIVILCVCFEVLFYFSLSCARHTHTLSLSLSLYNRASTYRARAMTTTKVRCERIEGAKSENATIQEQTNIKTTESSEIFLHFCSFSRALLSPLTIVCYVFLRQFVHS